MLCSVKHRYNFTFYLHLIHDYRMYYILVESGIFTGTYFVIDDFV